MPDLVAPVTCHRCDAPGQQKIFCQSCGLYLPDATATVERVTFTRRFFGTDLLEALLVLVTLVIGWLIWFAFIASKAQSPAKRILNVYVIDTDTGRAVSGGRMWVRDPLVKFLVIGNIPFAGLVDGLFVLFDKNRQSLHDKIVSTVVVYAPMGLPESMRNDAMAAAGALLAPGSVSSASSVASAPSADIAAPSSVTDVSARLRELSRLRDEGILTAEEYDQKRSELAGKL